MDNDDELPPGIKFSPSDEILLVCYLRPKVYGKELPCNMVEDMEIYGHNANPWHLFDASSTSWTHSGKSEKSVYVFTRLTRIVASSASNNNKKTEHYVRKAGCGTWHDETGREKIMFRKGENVVIGYKRLLVYQINDIGGLGHGINLVEVGYWKMHEYSLEGFEDYVLCEITWDISKRAKVVRSKKAEVVSVCPETLSRSRSSTKRNGQRNTHVTGTDDSAKVGKVDTPLPTNDGSAEVGANDRRLSSEKNGGVLDLGLVQDNCIVQEGSVNLMNTDCTLQASTSCPNDVSGDGILLDMEKFFTDWSEEELANFYKCFSPNDMDEMLNTLDQEYSAALSSPSPDNNNDEQHPMQNYCIQVLGKRKSIETEQLGKKLCI